MKGNAANRGDVLFLAAVLLIAAYGVVCVWSASCYNAQVQYGDALYFSRSRIPFDREGGDGEILGHIGLYAFRMGALERFVSLPQSPLEKREKLEQLRFLENGVPIRVVRVEGYEAHGVDTPEDLETIRELLAEHTCKSCVR